MPFDVAAPARVPKQRAETARIGQARHPHGAPGAELEIGMIVRTGRRRRRQMQAPRTRHAEMRDQRAVREAPQQVFAAPIQPQQRPAGEQTPELRRHRPAQAPIAHPHRAYRQTFDVRGERAARDLDFGQFGHGERLD